MAKSEFVFKSSHFDGHIIGKCVRDLVSSIILYYARTISIAFMNPSKQAHMYLVGISIICIPWKRCMCRIMIDVSG